MINYELKKRYIENRKERDVPYLTSIQNRFLDLLLYDEELIRLMTEPGDMVAVFRDLSLFLKNMV